ncbi:MAG: hypothetical protein ABH807_02205, partial [Candidatus Shapirobacteria bacterium]
LELISKKPINFINVKPGKSFDSSKPNQPPYISIDNNQRIILDKNELVQKKMQKMQKLNFSHQESLIGHFLNIITLFEKLVTPIDPKLNLGEKIDFIIQLACK